MILQRKYGIQSNSLNVPTVPPDKVSHPKGGYQSAVNSTDQCHAHPYGTALLVDGQWYWRDIRANLLPLLYGNFGVIPGMKCRCPLAQTD